VRSRRICGCFSGLLPDSRQHTNNRSSSRSAALRAVILSDERSEESKDLQLFFGITSGSRQSTNNRVQHTLRPPTHCHSDAELAKRKNLQLLFQGLLPNRPPLDRNEQLRSPIVESIDCSGGNVEPNFSAVLTDLVMPRIDSSCLPHRMIPRLSIYYERAFFAVVFGHHKIGVPVIGL